jgi:hypothetical protein
VRGCGSTSTKIDDKRVEEETIEEKEMQGKMQTWKGKEQKIAN